MAKSGNPTAFGSMDDIRKVFNKFDKNGDGKISCSEVVDNLSELGTKVSPAEVELIMKEFDKDGDGYIDLDEFVDFIQNGGLGGGDGGGNDSKELRDAFDLYDTNKNGLISVDELHSVMRTLGLKCSLSDCRNMIREVDQDGDGNVNFEEFKKMMTKGEENKSYQTKGEVIDWSCTDTNIRLAAAL
uniref:EF-hand domain-containing protein n=1 Tax=Salix viminalis TaxID=40686 RepID=A0A6N2LQA8_SALVM